MKKYFITLLTLFLSGCLVGDGYESGVKGSPSATKPPCLAGFCTTTATADKAGYQWMGFEYDFDTTLTNATFYLENAPSWLKIDKANTRVYGTPSGAGVYTNVNIHAYDGTFTEIIGPFTITVTADPLAIYSWHIKNTGQKAFAKKSGTSGKDMNLLPVYALGYTGEGVEVLVSDTGVEITHEDLTNNISPGRSSDYFLAGPPWTGNPDPSGSDDDFHGTAVSGILGAEAWNGLGGRGVAPKVSLAGTNYIAEGADQSLLVTIDQASNDFDIYNYSYGFPQCTYSENEPLLEDQLIAQSTTQRNGLGSIYVKSAGNGYVGDSGDCTPLAAGEIYFGNSNLDGLNTTPYVIVTGALNAKGQSSGYSSPGSNIWISAPGGEYGDNDPAIIAPDLTGCNIGKSRNNLTDDELLNTFEDGHTTLNPTCSYTSTMNGTSSAAPNVSGVIALMLEANPNLSWRDVKDILARTATQVDSSARDTRHPLGYDVPSHVYQNGWVKNKAGFYFHNWYGFGGINAGKAVAAALTHTTLPDLVTTLHHLTGEYLYSTGTLNLLVPDFSATGVTSNLTVRHNLKIETVQVEVTIDHPYWQDLGVEITSPQGTKSKLLNINSGLLVSDEHTIRLMSNAFYDEPSGGIWKLKVIDGFQTDLGNLKGWKINIFGHVNANRTDVTPPNAPATVVAPPTYNSLTQTPTVLWTHGTPADVMRYEVSVGTSAGDDDIAAWQPVGDSLSTQIETDVAMVDGNTYYFNVRAVDAEENVSASTSDAWDVEL